MTRQVFYRYLGTNGVIDTPIHLEDIYYVRVIALQADDGKVLTDGQRKLHNVRVAEEEVGNWREIPDGQ